MTPTNPSWKAGERRVHPGGRSMSPPQNRAREIPSPWIDCEACGQRHYPSTTRGLWYIATSCVSCGTTLPPGS